MLVKFLLIPLFAVVLMLIICNRKINKYEFGLIFGIPIIVILISYAINYFSNVMDTEYLSSYAITANYEEPWDEEVPCTHEITRTYTDKNGNTHTEVVGHRHSYDVSNHPAEYYVIDNCGKIWNIDNSYFNILCKRWNNKNFKDMHRDYHSKDGDMYISTFNNKIEDIDDYCTTSLYKNKIQTSSSVFNYSKIDENDKKQYGLYDYHTVNNCIYNPIYGVSNNNASHLLQSYNAYYGKFKQLTMLLLVFNNQPYDAGELQESLWKGGNKNEFIVCIGKQGDTIDWVKVISWTENDILKQEVVSHIKDMKTFNIVDIVKYMGETIPKSFKRKEFSDFNYITVEFSPKSQLIVFVLTMISTVIICVVSYIYDIDINPTNQYKFKKYRRY